MNKRIILILLVLAPFFGIAQFDSQPESKALDKTTGSVTLGSTTADGKNYQQAGARIEIPIGKFGIGLDIQLLFDQDGKIREADWDQFQDYLDKIYYLRYGQRGEPFYVKLGGLQYSTMGFGNVVKDYTNMLEYPTYKRWGMEMSFKSEKFGGEFLINDFKDIMGTNPGMMGAARLTYKPIGDLTIGVTVAGDLNEYNGFHDNDGDGVPDDIDFAPLDKSISSEYDQAIAKLKAETTLTDDQITEHANIDVRTGLIKDATRGVDQFNIQNETSRSMVVSADISYPVIDGEKVRLDVYSHFTQILGYGSGFAAPGLRLKLGNSFSLYGEYRNATKEFMFGYFNSTYDIERAVFVTDPSTNKQVAYTRQDRLADIQTTLNGYYVGADLNLANIIKAGISYQDLIGADKYHQRTLRAEAGLAQDLIPMVSELKAYYFQDNVQDFRDWKTPSTVMGVLLGYNMNGVVMGIDYRFTFKDLDGSGKIDQSNETFKTIAFRTRVSF